MPKVKISEYSATANSNTDVASINIDEGCAPSGINNAIRAIMGHLKDFQSGTSNDPFTIGSSGSLTLSYGTANGVAYLNGSKAVTSGSALKFDGTALAIGSVTPSTWMLDVKSAGTGVVTNGIRFNRSNVTTQYGVFNYESGQFNNVVVNTAGTGCFWGVLYSSDGSTTTQPLALDASGNLGVGTTSPNNKLDVVSSGDVARFGNTKKLYVSTDSSGYGLFSAAGQTGTGIYANDTSSFMYFATGSTERARIDSSGNLLVGKTASAVSSVGAELRPGGVILSTLSASTNADLTYQVYSTGAGAYRFYVGMGGTVFATSTSITAISDQRLKENVRSLDTGLNAIMALQPRRFDWKEGKGQDKKDVAGFIAQEFETVFPESVGLSKAGADGIEYKNINHETLIPTLVKALQEMKAIIDDQAARIAVLEAK